MSSVRGHGCCAESSIVLFFFSRSLPSRQRAKINYRDKRVAPSMECSLIASCIPPAVAPECAPPQSSNGCCYASEPVALSFSFSCSCRYHLRRALLIPPRQSSPSALLSNSNNNNSKDIKHLLSLFWFPRVSPVPLAPVVYTARCPGSSIHRSIDLTLASLIPIIFAHTRHAFRGLVRFPAEFLLLVSNSVFLSPDWLMPLASLFSLSSHSHSRISSHPVRHLFFFFLFSALTSFMPPTSTSASTSSSRPATLLASPR